MANATHVQDIRDVNMLNKATKARVEQELEDRRHERYGGFKLGAALLGWLTATGLSTILLAALSGAGAAFIASQLQEGTTALDVNRIGVATGLMLLLISALAYFAGGYVAGRLARFDGVRQGVGVWLTAIAVALLATLAGAMFGANLDLLQQMNLSGINVDLGSLTATGITTLILVLGVTLVSAVFGAKLGESYHRKVDQAGL